MCESLSVQRLLLERLAALNPRFNVATYLETFRKLPTNLDRVNYVYKDIKKYNLFPNAVKEGKDDTKSERCREEGNEAFGEGEYRIAMQLYTCSILTAKSVKMLALGYANRSATLYKMGRYQECLMDIERALANNYPDNLKPKLITRRKHAEKLLNSSKPVERYHQDIPQIAPTERHPTITSANKCIEIKTNEEFGRHIVATRDIEIGEVLCVEKPYAYALSSDRLARCHTCVGFCYNPIPCEKCIFLLFCSEDCKNKACNTFHKYECSVIATLRGCGISSNHLIAIRVAVLSREHNSSELEEQEVYRSDRFKEISELMAGTDNFEVGQLYQQAVNAAFIFHIFLNHTSFFNCRNNDVIKNQFKENVLSQTLVVHLNSLPICEHTKVLFEWEDLVFAHGLYSFASLFNHSCCPNVVSTQYGSTTVMRTINTIKKGQQCFITYGFTYWTTTHIARFFMLKQLYFFECRCVACVKNWRFRRDQFSLQWPAFLDMSGIEFLVMEIELNAGNEEVAKKYLPHLITQLKKFEHFEPWGNVIKIKKLILACYKILGNKIVV